MASVDERQLKQMLINGEKSNVYFVYGKEDYVKRVCVNLLIKTFAPDGNGGFDFKKISASDAKADDVISACETMPWMSKYTFVLVTDFPFDSLDEKEYESFKQYLSEVPDSCVLVFWQLASPGAKAQKQTAIINLAGKVGTAVKCEIKTRAEIEKTIEAGIKKRGCTISRSNLSYLIECVGCDLYLLLGEVQKLTALRQNGEITRGDIDALTTKSIEAKAFDITTAVLSGRCEIALSLLQKLFALREEPNMILGALISNYSDAYRAKNAIIRDGNANALAECFACYKKSSFRVQKGEQAARKLTVEQLRRALDELDRTDELLKRSKTDERQALEELIIRLAAI